MDFSNNYTKSDLKMISALISVIQTRIQLPVRGIPRLRRARADGMLTLPFEWAEQGAYYEMLQQVLDYGIQEMIVDFTSDHPEIEFDKNCDLVDILEMMLVNYAKPPILPSPIRSSEPHSPPTLARQPAMTEYLFSSRVVNCPDNLSQEFLDTIDVYLGTHPDIVKIEFIELLNRIDPRFLLDELVELTRSPAYGLRQSCGDPEAGEHAM
jgi:hypothetical protein